MKIHCGPSWWEKHLAKKTWHRWFAWRPARVASGDCRWLEYVERKGEYWDLIYGSGWTWEYRASADADHG